MVNTTYGDNMLHTLLLESNYNIDHNYLQTYFSFLDQCSLNELTEQYEKHHILPKSLFPQLSKNRNNIIKLKPRDHFLAHYHLAKLIKEKQTIFAFNQMKRVLKKYKSVISDVDSLSLLYEEFRTELSQIISEQNTNWFKKLPKEKQITIQKQMSLRSKGKVPVKYPNGKITSIDNTHPDYINGIAIPIQTGTKRSEKARENFRRANSVEVKGKPWHDPITKKTKYFHENEQPTNWIIGTFPGENSGKKGSKWYYNPITKEQGRFYHNEIPEGWIHGRINFGKNGNPLWKKSNTSSPA